ncbi:MAG: hypothetical protein KGI04_02115 [Candidatus Micrarchaeota archaeon]|nr:hypothetical protein [Candidatus Micrarchaeota archaeon]
MQPEDDASTDALLKTLHQMLEEFAKSITSAVETNKQVSVEDILEMREKLKKQLSGKAGSPQTQNLVKMLNLLSSDQTILELVSNDAEEWLELVDIIEDHLKTREPLNDQEMKELKTIKELSAEIRSILHKRE